MDNSIVSPVQTNTSLPSGSCLKFQLEQTTAAFSMEYVEEVIVASNERITPVPNMPECIMGLLNRRNRVLWVIDLGQMLELQPITANNHQHHLVIIRVEQVRLALVVREIKGVISFSSDSIHSPDGLVAPNLSPYLNGCILQQQEMFLLLNPEAIIQSPSLQNDYVLS